MRVRNARSSGRAGRPARAGLAFSRSLAISRAVHPPARLYRRDVCALETFYAPVDTERERAGARVHTLDSHTSTRARARARVRVRVRVRAAAESVCRKESAPDFRATDNAGRYRRMDEITGGDVSVFQDILR
jgi:hypothetical protein